MNDDLTLLASAYLDGDVDDAERTRVESDATLLAEVERLRYVQALLRDTEPSPISTREALLANALDAWDRLPATERNRDATPLNLPRNVDPATAAAAATITAPTSLADRRRGTLNRRMLAAAAAITMVLGGGVAAQVLTSGNDDDSDTIADSAAGVDALEAPSADSAEADQADSELAATSAELAGDAAESGEAAAGELDTGINDPAPPAESDLERLRTPDDLAIFASDAVGAPQAPDVPAATSAPIDDRVSDTQTSILAIELPLCLGADYVVGLALYGDTVVVVAVDEGRDLALAYDATSCTEVARARLP